VLDALYAAVHPMAAKHYHAFFSSELGGIVTDPALMFVHIDDHMVHRCDTSRPSSHPGLSSMVSREEHRLSTCTHVLVIARVASHPLSVVSHWHDLTLRCAEATRCSTQPTWWTGACTSWRRT